MRNKKAFTLLFGLLLMSANELSAQGLSVGIIPQNSAKKLFLLWQPLIKLISKNSGLDFHLEGSSDIRSFQARLLTGEFDLVYVNPLQYIIANKRLGYKALARESNKELQGILVVSSRSGIESIEDLNKQTILFPKNAFAATDLVQSYLKKMGITYNAEYVFSHDGAYKFVVLGKYKASGGVVRTFNALDVNFREKLKILKVFKGVTPHAFAIHPRVSVSKQRKIQRALLDLAASNLGRTVLFKMGFNALVAAKDTDWDDVRSLSSVDVSQNTSPNLIGEVP